MRVTFSTDKKTVGKRVKVRLKTRDIQEAIARRDVILSSYRVLGFQMSKIGGLVMKPKGRIENP